MSEEQTTLEGLESHAAPELYWGSWASWQFQRGSGNGVFSLLTLLLRRSPPLEVVHPHGVGVGCRRAEYPYRNDTGTPTCDPAARTVGGCFKHSIRTPTSSQSDMKWLLQDLQRFLFPMRSFSSVSFLSCAVTTHTGTKVETTIEGRIQEACFVVKNRLALRHFQQNRSARIIQKRVRDRAILVRQAAAILVRAIRRWFVRTKCRRECIRKSILRHRGSLSRRDLGIPELEPAPLTLTATNALLARAGGIPQEGRWWDTGAPVVPRPRWGNARVENEEARSRLRAASLADLIRTSEKRSPKTAARTMVGAEVDSKWRHEKHVNSDDSDGADSPSSFRRKRSRVGNGRGRLHGTRSMKSLSMIDAREAEKAAWEHEMERRKIKREAGLLNLDRKKKLSVFEKHLYRQRDFEVQKEKRVLAAEKEVLRRVSDFGC